MRKIIGVSSAGGSAYGGKKSTLSEKRDREIRSKLA
jgi:hypothetical protein